MSDAQSSAPGGAIQVTTGYMALAFLLTMVKTRVAIDGYQYELPWGTNVFPVPPGTHRVRVGFKYIFMSYAGANEVDVTVRPGETVAIEYRAPWLVFLKGKMRVGPAPSAPSAAPAAAPAAPPAAAPATAPAAGWHPDPSGRHEHRYWDGKQWTADVSDQGVTSTDSA